MNLRVCQLVNTSIGCHVTCVSDINLKTASKFFASSFSCGSSVTGDDEIVIQGDVKDDLFDIISEKWPQASLLVMLSCRVISCCH